MFQRAYLLLAFLLAIPALSQVAPEAAGGAPPPEDDTYMKLPPPVNGLLYPTKVGEDTETNFLETSIAANGAYIDNLQPGVSAPPVSATAFSIVPTLSVDRTSSQQHAIMTYSPSFVFYEPAGQSNGVDLSKLDGVDQSASLYFQQRLSTGIAISLQDFFMRTSDVFNQSYPFQAGGLGGEAQTPAPPAIAPFAEQLRNTANGTFSYQFGENGMIGGGGTYSISNFPNPADSQGLYNSNSGGGDAFYNRRLTRRQYAGISFDYTRTLTYPLNLQVNAQTQTYLPFYSIYFRPTFSLSISGGAQRVQVGEAQYPFVNLGQSQQPPIVSWAPAANVSLGWQIDRANLVVSYLHIVTAGEGLLGAYNTDNASLSGGWKFARTWNAGGAFNYANINSVTPLPGLIYQGGNTLSVGATLEHSMGQHFTMVLGYDRLHENYIGIAVISANPDSDRAFATVTYSFKKRIGR